MDAMRARLLLLCAAVLLASCSDSGLYSLPGDGGARDLATGGAFDLAGADLLGYSDVGGPCGGFTTMPKRCLPGLICQPAGLPDAPGTCVRPDGGACQGNGGACITNDDCCSHNCITRTSPGFCCQPGGCP
jgi:hypothetical protein